ncbi:MAG: hypothetical protein ACTSV5_01925 [Promethearchaeota archaeon]
MGLGVDLNLLESLSSGDNLEKVQEIFNSIMINLEEKLGIEPYKTNIKIGIIDEENLNLSNPFEFGVNRSSLNEIYISERSIKFLPQILLRECYKSFIIPQNRNSIPVQFIVCMIIESELETSNNITEWKKIIRSYEKYWSFLAEDRDMVIKFFKLEDPDTKENVIPSFIRLINSLEPDLINDTIFDIIVIEYMNRIKSYFQDDSILETIKVLKEIFFSVKNYRALLDYQDFFKKFKESGIITTDLSLRKFSSNVRWLNKHSFCAPDYHLDWFTINMAIYIIHIRFHPYCKWKNIKMFIKTLPFFLWPQLSAIGFTREFFGYIIIPTSYIKDLKQSLEFFEETGFFHEIKLYEPETGQYYLNLNYYRNLTEMGKLLHSQRKGYRKDFELIFKTRYQKKVVLKKLSLLDFIILDRVRHISFTGFGFERRESTLKDIKSDLLNEISYQKNIMVQLRNLLDRFSESPDLKKKFLNLIQINKKYSFFTFKEYIEQIVDSIKLAIGIIERNSLVTDPVSFTEYVKKNGISVALYENLNLNIQRVRDLLVNDLIPLYFQNKNLFNEEYKAFLLYNEFLSICTGLKIYDLNSVKFILAKEKLDMIYRAKEEKLDLIYKESQLRNITSAEIENRLEDFSTSVPPIISPKMLDSLIAVLHSTISFIFLAKKTERVLSVVEELSHTIPHYNYYELNDIMEDQELIFCRFGIQEMDMNEKYEFYSIMHNQLGEDLVIFTRYIHQGYYYAFSRRSYYDYIEGTFFYTSHLYSEFKKKIRDRFGKNINRLTIQAPKDSSNFWLSKTSLISFINELNQRRITEPQHFDLNLLNQLIDFNKLLSYYLLNVKNYQVLKEKPFFSFVKSINLKAVLQEFGLQKYYLYFQATDFNAIIPKLLLINTFTSVRFNSPRFDTYSFLIKYIFPYNNPNQAYLNWQLFSKKNINEYCLFSIRKTHEIFDFSKNITPDGWRIDHNLFLQYVQKVLFDPSYNPYNPNTKTLNFEKAHIDSYISPANPKFKDLLKIFKRKSNIKSFWGTKKGSQLELVVQRLLKNKLIHPFLKFKNLKLRECLYFIIPNLNEEQVKILLKLFQFFNVVTISEITGEFFLNSSEELITFNKGLYIKLKLPEMEISPYIEVIIDVFDHLKIKHFIFLSELFKSEKWPNKVFKGYDLNNNYNPLINLQWNDLDKIYMNHKLFGENFTPQYPKLNSEE